MFSAAVAQNAAAVERGGRRRRARARRGLVLAPFIALVACAVDAARPGAIEGVVLDRSGRGVGGLTLTLSGAAAAEAHTDGQGRYVFRHLPAGEYGIALKGAQGATVPRTGTRSVAVSGRRATRASFAALTGSITRIAELQGRGHVSPYAGRAVEGVPGIVTALRAPAGFYIQSPLPDASPDTSEGLFVAVARMPQVALGDLVVVDGRVEEWRPPDSGPDDLSVTRLVLTGLRRLGRDFGLPEPTVIGEGGRTPPDRVVYDDADGNVERGTFDPVQHGIDFYESLEGMLVRVNDALVVGSLHPASGEFHALGDYGRRATTLTARGGLALLAGDSNPERITVDLKGEPDLTPQTLQPLSVGDRFAEPIVGVLDYNRSEYKLLPLRPLPQALKANLSRQIATLRDDERTLTCAAINACNFSFASPREKAVDLAETIVKALHSPCIVAVSEMQDDSGPADDGTVTSEKGARALLDAIKAAGGPATYRWRDIAPANNSGGGQPGANIRVGFLYDRERVQLVERMGDSARSPVIVRETAGRPDLSFSPGLVGLGDPAFLQSRKPLAAEFLFRGQRIFFVAAHLTSKSGDAQPFTRVRPLKRSDAIRLEEAKTLYRFVASILSRDPEANIVVLGDLNDFAYSPAMLALKGTLLSDMAEQRLPPQERYTYVYRGNSQDLDHILVSRSLLDHAGARFEIVHRYAEFLHESRFSDHDPVLAAFRLR